MKENEEDEEDMGPSRVRESEASFFYDGPMPLPTLACVQTVKRNIYTVYTLDRPKLLSIFDRTHT